MPKRRETPFDKIIATRMRLQLYTEYGDAALDGRSFAEFAAEVHECFEYLITFRNIINGMVSFDDTPENAVLPYLPAREEV